MERQQQEEAAQHLVVDADPSQRQDGRGVQRRKRPRAGPAVGSEPRADGSHQGQVGELGGEDDDLEGQASRPKRLKPSRKKRRSLSGRMVPCACGAKMATRKSWKFWM